MVAMIDTITTTAITIAMTAITAAIVAENPLQMPARLRTPS